MVYKCIRKCYYKDRYFKEGDTLTCKETDELVPRHFVKVRLQSEVVDAPEEKTKEKTKERIKGVALKDLADEAKEQDEAEFARLGLGPKKNQPRDKKGK